MPYNIGIFMNLSINIQNLISRGYDVNRKNSFGQTPLHGVFFDTAENSLRPDMTLSVKINKQFKSIRRNY